VNLKNSAVIAIIANRLDGERNVMKIVAFVTFGAASLALAACDKSNQDAVQNAQLNQPSAEQLNDLAAQAAMDAANAQAQAQANVHNQVGQENAAVENVTSPAEADEQNVSGM
jgi:hypothetical protein